MQKKFIHKEKEICNLCHKEINTNIDDWTAITDFKGKTQIITKFYHRKCLTDLVEGKGAVIRKNFEEKLGAFTKKMFGNLGLKQTAFGTNLQELTA
jgi:hypothetical protein